MNTAYQYVKTFCEQSLAIYNMEQQLTEVQIKLINILEEYFRPAENAETHPLHSTADMFQKLQSIFPSKDYEPEDVLAALMYLRYEVINATTGIVYWLIQPKP